MISQDRPFILASRSPRRQELLRSISLPFVALAADVDEAPLVGEEPGQCVKRIAEKKLVAARRNLAAAQSPFSAILTADTIVTIDSRIVGKPVDSEESLSTIESLCGRTHQVFTAYALLLNASEHICIRTVRTEVTLRAAHRDELERYVQTGDGMDKAGAYSIQGQGGFLVEKIAGSYSNVVGLPLCELVVDLKELGLLVHYP